MEPGFQQERDIIDELLGGAYRKGAFNESIETLNILREISNEIKSPSLVYDKIFLDKIIARFEERWYNSKEKELV